MRGVKEIYIMDERLNEAEFAERIRKGYMPEEENDMERLRKLDRKVRRPAEIAAYTVGIAGALVLGTGMCITMGVIGASNLFPLGVVVGVVGLAIAGLNYFMYRAILKRRKKKYAGEVLELSDKLLNR